MEPKFSLIIPTRERHETLYYAIKSALSLNRQDYEVIICDNFSSSDTKKVVEQFNDTRLKYSRSTCRLSMVENFERGLELAEGSYISFIGDDDCIIPATLDDIEAYLDFGTTNIACWHRCAYFWPSYDSNPNILFAKTLPYQCELPSQKVLEATLNYYLNYQDLPSIYNSWISRDVIEKIKIFNEDRLGIKKFFPPGVISCDVFSALQVLYFSKSFLYFSFPFSLSGISKFSNGMGQGKNDDSINFYKESGKNSFNEMLHPSLRISLAPENQTPVSIVSDFLHFIDLYLEESNKIQIKENLIISGINTLLLQNHITKDEVFNIFESNTIHLLSLDHIFDFHNCGFKYFFRIPQDENIKIDVSKYGINNAYEAANFYQNLLSESTIP